MIWVVSELYYPEETSTGHYMTGIAEGLAKTQPVKVLCAKPTYSKRGLAVAGTENHNGVAIERCWSTRLNKNVVVYRLMNAFSTSFSLFWLTLRRVKRGDAVLVVTNPPSLPFATVLACRLKGARCHLRVDDVFPESFIYAGMMRAGGMNARLVDALHRWLFHRMDSLIVLGRCMGALVRQKLGRKAVKMTMIPNWADLQEVFPLPRARNALLEELGLGDKFVIGYFGNIGPVQGVENLFETALRLREVPDVHFLFVGHGKRGPWLAQSIKNAGLQNVTLAGHRPRHEQMTFLNACDVGVVSLTKGMAGTGVPSRAYNLMAAGKPILAVMDREAEIARVVEEERIGWVVSPDAPEKLVAAVLAARARAGDLAEMGQRARSLAEKQYAVERVVEAYAAIMSNGVGAELPEVPVAQSLR